MGNDSNHFSFGLINDLISILMRNSAMDPKAMKKRGPNEYKSLLFALGVKGEKGSLIKVKSGFELLCIMDKVS